MQNRLYIIIAIFIHVHSSGVSQDLEKIITVNYTNQSLATILNNMERDLGLKFSFLQNAIPLDTTITIKVNDQPLRTILDFLSKKAGLEYKVVKDHIALFHQLPEPIEKKSPLESVRGLPQMLEASVISLENVAEESEQMAIDTFPNEIKYAQLTAISNKSVVEPQNSIPILLTGPSKGYSITLPESPRMNPVTLGIAVAADFYRLSASADENTNFKYRTGINYSMGLSADMKIKERWNILVQVLYSTKNFGLYYNFQTTDQEDPFIPTKTVYKQAYLDIPVLMNYRVLEKNKWKLFGEGGFVPGFILTDKQATYRYDGSEMQTEDFLLIKIRHKLFGAQLGAAAVYQITEHLSLNLNSGWRQYFKGINNDNLSTNLGLFQSTVGIRCVL